MRSERRAPRWLLAPLLCLCAAPSAAWAQADEVGTYLALLRYARAGKTDLVEKSLAMLAPATERVRAAYGVNCAAQVRQAAEEGATTALLRSAHWLIALDMRWHLDHCAKSLSRRSCNASLTQAALRYALITDTVAARALDRDQRIRRSFKRAKRVLRRASPYARETPVDKDVVDEAMTNIWREAEAAFTKKDPGGP